MTVVIVEVQRADTSYCLPSLKLQIEDALTDYDPWSHDMLGVRVLLNDPLSEEESIGLYQILQRLEGPAEGWRYLETQEGDQTWITVVGSYAFTVFFRCIDFTDLVNDP